MVCWFCGTKEADGPSVYRLHMYGDLEVSETAPGIRRQAYTTQTVDTPRCADCKRRHKNAALYSVLILVTLLGMLCAAVLAVFNLAAGWLWGLILGLSIGLAILFLVLRILALKGIRSEGSAKKDYPEIEALITRCYVFGKNPSYADYEKLLPKAQTAVAVQETAE